MAYLVFFGLPAALLILGFPIFLILLVTSIVAVLTVADVQGIVYIRTLVTGGKGNQAGKSIDTIANTGQYL